MTTHGPDFMDVMIGNIQYWRHVHGGVLTPSGKQKKVPWFLLVRCPKDHVTVTNIKRTGGMRFRCSRIGFRPGTGTVKCERQVGIIEIPNMKELFGLSKEEAIELHEQWKEKYT